MITDYGTSDWPALPPMSELVNRVICMDALELFKLMPSESVNCIATSPPYFGLRDYGISGQIGMEATPAEYVQTLVKLFREARRVLRNDGVFWLNLGDSYNGSGKGEGNGTRLQTTNAGSIIERRTDIDNLPPKNLIGIPWKVAFALQDDGWILRMDNVWHKPNPMPESVRDRTTKAHEYVFQFAKSNRYWFDIDAIKEPVKESSIKRSARAVGDNHKNLNGAPGQTPHSMFRPRPNKQEALGKRQYAGFNERYEGQDVPMANKRSVWTIPTHGTPEAHFATFPRELAELMIKAGCPRGGIVHDPFMGSGTIADVARELGRQFTGSELNPVYVDTIINKRLSIPYQERDGLFAALTVA